MTGYPKQNSLNGFLSPPTEIKTTNSKRGRTASFTGSESARSSLSRITRVEEDAQIPTDPGLEYSNSITPSNYSCLYHLVAIIRIIFCIPVSKKMKTKSSGPVEGVSSGMESSPWVLPVLVLSTRRDTDKQPVPKRAKCTIDTGNMQGNIVSKEFVKKVLEYSESNFVPLTAEESEGGFGVTGHKLVPEGAIYLTWYHSKSTRVFHNMRFLISPHSQCDLIIGARSIQKDNLLGVPNLMATANNKVTITNPITDEELEDLQRNFLKCKKRFMEKDYELRDTGEDTETNEVLKDLENNMNIAEKHHLIRKAEIANNHELVANLKEDLEKLPGYKNYAIPSKSDTTSSGTQQNGGDASQRKVKKTVEPSSTKK